MHTPPAELLEINLVCYPSIKQTFLFLFVWLLFLRFFVGFTVGREQDREMNHLLFGGEKPLYQGNCLWDHSLTEGMNPWSQVRCRCCWDAQCVYMAGADWEPWELQLLTPHQEEKESFCYAGMLMAFPGVTSEKLASVIESHARVHYKTCLNLPNEI